MTLRCFSYGGGVQSTGSLVLASWAKKAREELDNADVDKWLLEQDTPYLDLLSPYMMKAHVSMATLLDILDFPVFLFSNVGDDSEHPDTLRYVNEISKPYAAANGIELIELRKDETLLQYTLRHSERSGAHIIPIYLSSGMPGMRACTSNFKIRRIASWQKQHGATRETPAITGIGISIDEFRRMRTGSIDYQKLVYPLIDLRLSRLDCVNIIKSAGLPVPPKSSCWFCPYHTERGWRQLRNETPELFNASVDLEKTISDNSQAHGHDKVFFNRKLQTLDRVCAGRQLDMFDDDPDDTCESGFCMT